MTFFDDAQRAAEAADSDRTIQIVGWLDLHWERPYTRFFTVVDDAIYAEDDARVCGLYPPAGHDYPREN